MGARFSTPVHNGREPTYPSVQWLKGLFPGGKVVVTWPLLPTPSPPKFKKEYSYNSIPLWAFKACSRASTQCEENLEVQFVTHFRAQISSPQNFEPDNNVLEWYLQIRK